jgi:hypothetical protein
MRMTERACAIASRFLAARAHTKFVCSCACPIVSAHVEYCLRVRNPSFQGRMPHCVCVCACRILSARSHVQVCMRVRRTSFHAGAQSRSCLREGMENLSARAHAICLRVRMPYLSARAHARSCLRMLMLNIACASACPRFMPVRMPDRVCACAWPSMPAHAKFVCVCTCQNLYACAHSR